jgi:hypothetical protein
MDTCPASAGENPADGIGIDPAIPRHSRVVVFFLSEIESLS